MKEFNLEEAKAGKPVCTRNNKPARIICFDCKDQHYPIVALVVNGYQESVYRYTAKGKVAIGFDNSLDLMMLSEKKQGWVNVYRINGRDETGEKIYPRKESAISAAYKDYYIATVKIEWKE